MVLSGVVLTYFTGLYSIREGLITTNFFNTLRLRQNGRHFPEDIFKCIFLNRNDWTSHKISLKFVPYVRIKNIPALVQMMAWCWPGNKPLSEPMMVRSPTHIYIIRFQWVKHLSTSWLEFELFKCRYKMAFTYKNWDKSIIWAMDILRYDDIFVMS